MIALTVIHVAEELMAHVAVTADVDGTICHATPHGYLPAPVQFQSYEFGPLESVHEPPGAELPVTPPELHCAAVTINCPAWVGVVATLGPVLVPVLVAPAVKDDAAPAHS